MSRAWKLALGDILSGTLLLALSWVLTDHLPMQDRYVNLEGSNLNANEPPDEPAWVMIVFLWILPVSYLVTIHYIILRSFSKLALIVIGWFTTLSLVIFLTSFCRYFLPTPRPYFATKCSPKVNGGFMMDTNWCTRHISRRDMQSFPSGHTTLVWGSWVFCTSVAISLSRTLRHGGQFWKLIIFFLVPIVVPLWMSCDRIRTNNHTSYDVIFGGLLGILIGVLGWANTKKSLIERPEPVQEQGQA